MAGQLKAPFPYFGGKSRIAGEVWRRLGAVKNYVEPFAGSLAVLLNRPTPPGIETVNDKDRFIANFWRAIQADPDAVAAAADWPVNEADLEARHQWLVNVGAARLESLLTDPEAFDAKIAGWWCWGLCCWIGSGWCAGEGPWCVVDGQWARHDGRGISRQLPHLGNAGRGVNRQLPGQGINVKHDSLLLYFRQLADRLRRVRVACGDWRRVLTPSVTFTHGLTGIFLDPPYGQGNVNYSAGGNENADITSAVRDWAVANAGNPNLRIALCGYEGQYEMPPTWAVVQWKAQIGYASTAKGDTRGKSNRHRERIWFSPHCLAVESPATRQLELAGA